MGPRRVSVACAVVGAALVLPASAAGQIDPGVNYDPGSPAGKEYAIPLVEGRSDGAGTTDWQQGGNIPFGVGIEPRRPGQGDSRRSGSAEGQQDGLSRTERREQEALTARIRAAEVPGGTAGRTFLLALAVLVPAGVLALLLAQRPQPSRTGRAA